MVIENSYWNRKGKYEKKNAKLWYIYIPLRGVRLTANSKVNTAIRRYRKASKQYYRYYNDGDRVPGVTHRPTNYISAQDIADQKKMEKWMDKIILNLWKLSKGGKVAPYYEMDE